MWYELAQVLQTISMANQTVSGGPVRDWHLVAFMVKGALSGAAP